MIGTTFDTATTSLATLMLTHAENEIDKYLSKRFDLSSWTSTSIPPLVTSWCETLAEGYMYQRMSRGGKDAMDRGDRLIKQVKENLQQVADYKLDLIDVNGNVLNDMSQTAYSVLSNTSDYTPTFGEDDETSWKVDTDKLDDLESERD